MPQLDKSTWFTTVVSSSITLFILMKLKIFSQDRPHNPMTKTMDFYKNWELKWMSICLPLLLPL